MKRQPLNSMALTNDFHSEIEAASAIFGQRMIARRKALQLSQRDLASKVGVSVNTIQSYEAGGLPRGAHFLNVAKVLGCSLNWLVSMNEVGGFSGSFEQSESGPGCLPNSPESFSHPDYFFKPPFFSPDEEAPKQRAVGFNSRWLSEITSKPENVRLIVFKGPYMQPTISDGDLLLVDLGRVSIYSGYLYLIKIDGSLSVNRLMMKPGGYLSIVSDN